MRNKINSEIMISDLQNCISETNKKIAQIFDEFESKTSCKIEGLNVEKIEGINGKFPKNLVHLEVFLNGRN